TGGESAELGVGIHRPMTARECDSSRWPRWSGVHAGCHAGRRLRIDVFTIFPEMIEFLAAQSLLGKAQQRGLLDVRAHALRAATTDPHRTVDDAPFGGGAGMVLMPEPVFAAVEAVDPPR